MKNIIVTGASRGMGYDTALELVRQGNRVLALSRNQEALKELQQKAGERLSYLPFDVTSTNYQSLLTFLKGWEKVDVLINNAGFLLKMPFHEITDADWNQIFSTNFLGPARLLQTLQPYLENSDQAHVVNIGSMGGYQGSSKFPGLLAYSVSKAAFANLTECLAEEWKDKGIAVNCLALGAVQTEMLAEAFPGFQAPVNSEKMSSFIAYFALNGHHFFNGKVLPVSVSTP